MTIYATVGAKLYIGGAMAQKSTDFVLADFTTPPGGANWATAILALSQSLIGPKIYGAADIDLSGLPAGTSIV